MNRIWVVLALLTGVPALADGQETDPPGPIIDTIIVITHDIYSPEESSVAVSRLVTRAVDDGHFDYGTLRGT